MQILRKIYLIFFFLWFAVACSVEQKQVPNNPPVSLSPSQVQAELIGRVQFESASFFWWPEELTESELSSVIKTTLVNSKKIDFLAIKVDRLQTQNAALENSFFGRAPHGDPNETFNCVITWAELGPDEDPEFIEEVVQWKTLEPVVEVPAEDPDYAKWLEYKKNLKALQACKDNQSERRRIRQEIDQIVSVQQRDLIDQIYSGIDKGYPLNPSRIISVDVFESYLIFKPENEVEISLKDFNGQNSSDANTVFDSSYNSIQKLLKFKVAEVTSDGRSNNSHYEFELERAADFLGRVRFVGTMKHYEGSSLTRVGSAKIDGIRIEE